MEESAQPIRATFAVTFWRDDDGSIRLILADMQGEVIQGSMVTINDHPKRADGHPLLHSHLGRCLEWAALNARYREGGTHA